MPVQVANSVLTKPRIAFLLALALGVTLLFFRLIQSFLLAILMAAVLAGVVHPLCRRLETLFRGRKSVAAGLTVVLSLVLVVIPLLLFLGVLIGEAIQISEHAEEWVNQQAGQTGSLQQQLQEHPSLQRFLPYQDEIITKAGQLAAKAGSFVAREIAATARGTAGFLFMLFIMLYSMYNFLSDGPAFLRDVLRFTPLTTRDQDRLLGTFASVGRATLKGTLVIGIVQGGLAGLAFWMAGIQGAVFWGALMMVLSIIPGVGTALVWVPAVVFLMLNGQVKAGVAVALWCGVVVGTADNVLRPLLIGKDTEMPDLLVMLTTLGGLALFGAAGILIGPIIGALFMTVWQLWGSAVDEARAATNATTTTIHEEA